MVFVEGSIQKLEPVVSSDNIQNHDVILQPQPSSNVLPCRAINSIETVALNSLDPRNRDACDSFGTELVKNPDGTPLLDHNNNPVPIAKMLATKPLKSELASRPGPGNKKLTYLSGDSVTRTLNDIFGFDGWCLEIKSTTREECTQDDKGRYHVTYTAFVRVTHRRSGAFKEDCGAGDAVDRVMGIAISHALKASVTDAMKRAVRHFGDKLGNSLYQDTFSINKAPSSLKDALDMYEIERAQSKFGFDKDRKSISSFERKDVFSYAKGNESESAINSSTKGTINAQQPYIPQLATATVANHTMSVTNIPKESDTTIKLSLDGQAQKQSDGVSSMYPRSMTSNNNMNIGLTRFQQNIAHNTEQGLITPTSALNTNDLLVSNHLLQENTLPDGSHSSKSGDQGGILTAGGYKSMPLQQITNTAISRPNITRGRLSLPTCNELHLLQKSSSDSDSLKRPILNDSSDPANTSASKRFNPYQSNSIPMKNSTANSIPC